MKKMTILFLALLFLVVVDSSAQDVLRQKPYIIFVHIGQELPPYLYTALEQARLFNEDAHICLIANKFAFNNALYDFDKINLEKVFCESLKQSTFHNSFNKNTTLDKKHRNGFWQKATERFFYLHEYIALHDLKCVVHLESDVMLYADIRSMQHVLALYQGIAAVFDSDERCIPSFLYIADEKAIEYLVSFIAQNASKGYNDMYILGLYHEKCPLEYIDNLPLVIPEYLQDHSLMNACNQKARHPEVFYKNSHLFNSIFDGAAFGQYIGGIDPRNGNSVPGFINETAFVNPAYFTIEWHHDTLERKVPFVRYKNNLYRINNLHIHSKKLEQFKS